MVSAYELGKQARVAHHQQILNQRVKAVMGRRKNNGNLTLRTQPDGTRLPNGRIYVRVNDNDADTRVVYNLRMDARAGLACYIAQNPSGQWFVESAADQDAIDFMGEHAAGSNVPAKDVEASGNLIIPGAAFRPGSVVATSFTDLVFQVMPFYYRYLDSVKYWPNITTIDLSAYLPASSGTWAYVWVAVNPLDNTLTAVTSTEQALKQLLTADVLTAMDLSGLVPCDVLTLQEGDTAYTPGKHDIIYARTINEQYNPVLPTELGTGLIGAGRVLQLYGPITISGDLTIEGTLQIS